MFLNIHFIITEYSSVKLSWKFERDIVRNPLSKLSHLEYAMRALIFYLKHRKHLKLVMRTKVVYNLTSS